MTEEATAANTEGIETPEVPTETPAVSTETAEQAQSSQDQAQGDSIPIKRFNEVYWKQKNADRENLRLRQENEQLKNAAPSQPQQPQVPATTTGEPTLEQFDYDQDAFNNAVIDHRVNQKFSEFTQQQDQNKQATQQKETLKSFNEKAAQYAAKNPGYDEVLAASAGVKFNEGISQAVLASEFGPQIQHHLLSTPLEAERINSLPPIMAAMEIGKLESAFSSNKIKNVQVSNAPPPIDTASGSGGSQGDIRYDENVSNEDFYKASMEAKRGKR